jgi:hypothetical protein
MLYEVVGLLLVAGVAAYSLVPMFRAGRRQAAQKQWPRVAAEVLEHRIRESGGGAFPEYRVRYAYGGKEHDAFVGGADKAGINLTRARDTIRRAIEARMVRRRPVGATTELMVNPANAAEAYVLDRELPARALAYGIGAVFLILFVLFAIVTLDLV